MKLSLCNIYKFVCLLASMFLSLSATAQTWPPEVPAKQSHTVGTQRVLIMISVPKVDADGDGKVNDRVAELHGQPVTQEDLDSRAQYFDSINVHFRERSWYNIDFTFEFFPFYIHDVDGELVSPRSHSQGLTLNDVVDAANLARQQGNTTEDWTLDRLDTYDRLWFDTRNSGNGLAFIAGKRMWTAVRSSTISHHEIAHTIGVNHPIGVNIGSSQPPIKAIEWDWLKESESNFGYQYLTVNGCTDYNFRLYDYRSDLPGINGYRAALFSGTKQLTMSAGRLTNHPSAMGGFLYEDTDRLDINGDTEGFGAIELGESYTIAPWTITVTGMQQTVNKTRGLGHIDVSLKCDNNHLATAEFVSTTLDSSNEIEQGSSFEVTYNVPESVTRFDVQLVHAGEEGIPIDCNAKTLTGSQWTVSCPTTSVGLYQLATISRYPYLEYTQHDDTGIFVEVLPRTYFVDDGTLDTGGIIEIASVGDRSLWGSLTDTTLYLAVSTPSGLNYPNILLALNPGSSVPAPLDNYGQIAEPDAALVAVPLFDYADWEGTRMDRSNYASIGTVLEGSIDLDEEFGSVPRYLAIAASEYTYFGFSTPGFLNVESQIPASLDGDGDVDSNEYIYVPLCQLNTTDCCYSDFDQNGESSVFDLFEMLIAADLGDLSADIAPPYGTLDSYDIDLFLVEHLGGCTVDDPQEEVLALFTPSTSDEVSPLCPVHEYPAVPWINKHWLNNNFESLFYKTTKNNSCR